MEPTQRVFKSRILCGFKQQNSELHQQTGGFHQPKKWGKPPKEMAI